jgi:hypothetical protein
MKLQYIASLALAGFLLAGCGSSGNAASDNSAAAASPAAADSSDPLASYIPTFQKMEAGIDNDFSDLAPNKKSGQEVPTSIGFYPQYPCTVGTNADKSMTWGYCIMGVSASKANADADYAAAQQIIAKGDPDLKTGTPPASNTKAVAESLYANDTHAVYLFEQMQDNGKYIIKMTFAKPAALK